MKNNFAILAFLCFAVSSTFAQTTHTVVSSGLSYVPATLAVNVGDQVKFNSSFASHPLREVSQATWNANGTTALAGGFSVTTGTTFTVPITTATDRYYVCAVHAGAGMKGKITVTVVGTNKVAPSKMTTYPMPAAHLLHIATPYIGNITYTLTDLQGKAVLEGAATAVTNEFVTVDVSAIANGYYFLVVQNDQKAIDTQKIMIAR